MNKNRTREFSYSSAPQRIRERHGIEITSRQLQRWVTQGKVDHIKMGHRVIFLDAHLDALIESLTVRAVR